MCGKSSWKVLDETGWSAVFTGNVLPASSSRLPTPPLDRQPCDGLSRLQSLLPMAHIICLLHRKYCDSDKLHVGTNLKSKWTCLIMGGVDAYCITRKRSNILAQLSSEDIRAPFCRASVWLRDLSFGETSNVNGMKLEHGSLHSRIVCESESSRLPVTSKTGDLSVIFVDP